MIRKKIVSWASAAATVAVLLAPNPRVFAQEPPKGLEGSHEALDASVAARFAAMEKLSARFSTPEAASKLVDVLAARDAKGFNSLFGDLDLPLTGTCWWVHEVVEKAFEVAQTTEKQCTLKEDMTPVERALYIQIASKYKQLATLDGVTGSLTNDAFLRVLIAPGPFRDELEANGLLTCTDVTTSTGLPARPVVGAPFHFCLEDGRQR